MQLQHISKKFSIFNFTANLYKFIEKYLQFDLSIDLVTFIQGTFGYKSGPKIANFKDIDMKDERYKSNA